MLQMVIASRMRCRACHCLCRSSLGAKAFLTAGMRGMMDEGPTNDGRSFYCRTFSDVFHGAFVAASPQHARRY
jgi:hypothetical protein